MDVIERKTRGAGTIRPVEATEVVVLPDRANIEIRLFHSHAGPETAIRLSAQEAAMLHAELHQILYPDPLVKTPAAKRKAHPPEE